jgi:CspA family cold shock protein
MRQGTVKWYNGKKCFGFVAPDTANEAGNKEDVFVHSSALHAANLRFLNEGDVITFDDEDRNGKLSAINVKLISRDEESAKKFRERQSERHSSWDHENGHRDDNGERRGFFGKIFKKD